MGNEFTVIKTTDEDKNKEMNRIYRVALFNEAWERQYYDATLQILEKNKGREIADFPQEDLMKIALSGVKYICSVRDVKRENIKLGVDEPRTLTENQAIFQLIDAIFSVCGYLTLRNFVTTFPVKKDFDGHKWECKDYFYTMEVLDTKDWDKPIGRDNISDLLWDYHNDDLLHVYVEFTTAMSAIYRSQTGKGIAEKICEDMGIGIYTVDRETGVIKDNLTGNTKKLKECSHLRIVK